MSRATWVGLFIASLCLVNYGHAFSNERCGSLFPKSNGSHYPWFSPLYVSTMMPSTTSYFSSFGPCSMYAADSFGSRTAFVDSSLIPLQRDTARGKGEYLNALAELSGCPADKYDKFAKTMHKQFDTLFSEKSADSTILVQKIDSIVSTDTELKKSCTIQNAGL